MNGLTIYKDSYSDNTIVSNHFIDEYMIDANDAQIKIYLYLLRLISAHMTTSISEIADLFNYTEKDVLRALKYWEKKHLMKLDYDTDKSLCGVHFLDLTDSTPVRKEAQAKPAAEKSTPERSASDTHSLPAEKTVTERTLPAKAGTDVVSIRVTEKIAPVQTVPELPEKPVYSLDQLSTFKNNEKIRQLMFIVESYIGKPLTHTDVRTIFYLSDGLHFSDDLIDYLVQYCVERGKRDFRYIEKVGITWAENKVTTPKEAARYSSKYEKSVYSVMKALGKNDNPTDKEVSYVRKWTGDYAFDMDIITEACERTVLATDRHRFEYADGILANWRKNNVLHKTDIKQLDESHKQRSASPAAAASDNKNKFNQFSQNSYDFDELEKELMSN